MKKEIIVIILLFFISIITICYNKVLIADVGNFESYDSGSSWSSSYDRDSSWSRRDRLSTSGGYSKTVSFEDFIFGIKIIAAITIVVSTVTSLLYFLIKKIHDRIINYVDPVRAIKQYDPLFNKNEFLEWAGNLFVKMQMAWTERDWEDIRLYETSALFEQHKAQLQEYIDKRQINVVEVIQVANKEITSFEQIGDKDSLKVELETQMVDYIINEDSNSVIKGSIDRVINSKYELTFIRKTGIKSKREMLTINKINCPNCGAEMKISAAGKCEHCGSVVTTGEFNWVLSNLERKM